MTMESDADKPAALLASSPRFSWPMRIFISLILFDMIFHSLAEAVTPWPDWLKEFGLSRYPKALPTWKEIDQLRAKSEPDQPDLVWKRIGESIGSFPGYFNPWPGEKALEKLKTRTDWAKYVWCWVTSRLDFFEGLFGLEQEWTMFGPNVSSTGTLARFRLEFEDGTTLDVRPLCDPPDHTCYSRWFQVKVLDSERHTTYDVDCRLGYCHFLGRQFGVNSHGAKLTKIHVYKIRYYFPKPDEDAFDVLHSQNGPPDWDEDGPSWEYDPAEIDLESLSYKERQAAHKKLASFPSLGEVRPTY